MSRGDVRVRILPYACVLMMPFWSWACHAVVVRGQVKTVQIAHAPVVESFHIVGLGLVMFQLMNKFWSGVQCKFYMRIIVSSE